MTGWLSCISVGRRRRWLVVAAAILVVGAAAPLGTRFDAAQKDDPASFLPGGAESVRSLDQQRRFPSGAETLVVALGVLIDTLIVRSILVPGLLLDIGDRVWWPSRPAAARSASTKR